jgi:hypothetical protein
MAPDDPNVVAIAADYAMDGAGRRTFTLDEIAGIADFVVGRFALGASGPGN